jgi:hypothetical protein
MSELPTREDFLDHLNTKFRVYFDAERATEVELTEVSELRKMPRYEAFSLSFVAPNDVPPLQGVYKTEHDSLCTMELLLIPYEQSEKGLSFEAVFNYKI